MSTPASAPIRLWLAPWPDATRGWHWLRATLADALGCAADDLHIVRDVRGKPQLSATQAHWHFSLSHSGALALLALADLPVGVDLEAPRPQLRALALAARYFAADESAALQQLSHGRQALAFRQLWTAKEAVLKADGSGLAYGLERVAFAWQDGRWQPASFSGPIGHAAEWTAQPLQLPLPLVGCIAYRSPARDLLWTTDPAALV